MPTSPYGSDQSECVCDTFQKSQSGCSKSNTFLLHISLEEHVNIQLFQKDFFHNSNLFFPSCSGTIICVDTGVGYVDCASVQGPRKSESLSRVLDYPAAGGEVVPGVVVAVPAKTCQGD